MPVDITEELVGLRRLVLSMGATVESRVSAALDALVHQDAAAAQVVRHGDNEIDDMELALEAECVRILALHQPVASDLRMVLAVLRINTDLERVGDHAKGLAKRVLDLAELAPVELPHPVVRMASHSKLQLSNALSALADNNADLCRAVLEADRDIDALQRSVFQWAQEKAPESTDRTRTMIDIISAARAMERIGDLATNIAEDVIFLAEGEIVRHRKA